ncbi:MAG: glycosyltransferase [Chloroflexota bacterium]
MNRIAMLSVHTCPLAVLGGKSTGGMNVYVRELSRELGRRGYGVDIFTRCENANIAPIIEMTPNVRVVHICAGPTEHQAKRQLYPYLPEFADEVLRFAAAEAVEYDVIHSHYWLSGWVARELAQVWEAPIIQMFHTLGAMKNRVARSDEPREDERRIHTEREIIRFADRIIAATDLDQEQMVSLYDADPHKMKIIPCGVDLTRFRPTDKQRARQAIGLESDVKTVLFVGRMEPLKGIDDLLRAIARILRDHNMPCNRLSLILIGGSAEDNPDNISSEMARLMRMRDALGLQEMVTFLGAQGQDVLPLYYSAADVVVMPSHYESFGMVALEAMACGTPVVASDVGGLSYTVEDGVTGFLVPDRNPAALADRICDILNDELFRDQLGRQALQVAQQYSWQHVTDCIVDVYRAVAPQAFRIPPLRPYLAPGFKEVLTH